MNIPTKEQKLYSYITILEPVLNFIHDTVVDSELDDLELISDINKTRLSIKTAIHRLDEIARKQQEPKSVCY